MTYYELESTVYNKEVCLFGGGTYGKTRGYDYVTAFGLEVDFYCDNNIDPGTIVRDGIVVRDIQYLYENKDHIQVFLTVGCQYRTQIIDQLHEHDIYNIITVDWLLVTRILDSIDASDDELTKQRYHAIYNDAEFLERRFELKMGYKLDINHPKTFNEKLQWLKLYNRKPEYTRMVDKYEAKQFVEEKIGGGYTVPTLGVWDSFSDIEFNELPRQFVLKCTHDSGSVVVCRNKNTFDIEEAGKKLSSALDKNFFWWNREWPYKNVKRRIIAEEYIEEIDGNLFDYKVHCFNGEPTYIQVIGNRDLRKHTGLQLVYDFEWNVQEWSFGDYPKYKEELKKPYNLKELYQLSKILCAGLRYIRVDFYIISGRILVGEMTFYPLSGYYVYNNDWKCETDLMLGRKIKL